MVYMNFFFLEKLSTEVCPSILERPSLLNQEKPRLEWTLLRPSFYKRGRQ